MAIAVFLVFLALGMGLATVTYAFAGGTILLSLLLVAALTLITGLVTLAFLASEDADPPGVQPATV